MRLLGVVEAEGVLGLVEQRALVLVGVARDGVTSLLGGALLRLGLEGGGSRLR